MYDDVECPYYGKRQEINHDDGYGHEEDQTHEQYCSECEKTFAYTASIGFYYKAQKADCLNGGGEHKMEPVTHYPKHWPDWVMCKDCGHEYRGKFVEKAC